LFGNFALLGVILVYTRTPEAVKQATGWNFMPRSVGDEVEVELETLLARGAIRPVIGRVVGFDEVPAALEAMEARQTMGRTVVEVSR